jgi:predicted metalloprotease
LGRFPCGSADLLERKVTLAGAVMQKVLAIVALILAWAVTPSGVSNAAAGDPSKTTPSKSDSSKTDSSTTDSSKTTGSTSAQSAASPSASAQSTGPIESQILAFEALHNRAAEVALFLKQIEPSPTEIIVLDATQMGFIPGYQAFVAQSERLRSEFCAALSEAGKAHNEEALAIPTASQFSAAAGAATAVLALFKQTTSVTASAVTISDEAFVTAVGEALDHKAVSLYYPTLYPIDLGNAPPVPQVPNTREEACPANTSSDSTMQRIGALEYLRAASASAVSRIEAETGSKKAADQNAHARLSAANSTFDSAMAALSATDPASGRTKWDTVLSGERLTKHLKPATVVVEFKVQAAGGETTTRDGPFFFHGAKYDYSGGVILTAIVFDPSTGSVRAAKTFWEMSGNRERTTFATYKNK